MTKRNFGWKRQPHDPRDHYHLMTAEVTSIPTYVDLPGMASVPQLDQGQLGSCGPNAAAALLMYDMFVQALSVVVPSRLHTYWWTRSLMGTTGSDSGVDNRTLLKALGQYGEAAESLWPYDIAKYTQKPSDNCNQVALQDKVTDYAAVVQSLGQMKAVLASGKPFLFGFDVYQQMESDQAAQTGVVTDPPAGASPIGGHDVVFMGYSDVDRPGIKAGNKWPAGTFKFRNSWGDWGDGGYGYISQGYATDAGKAGDFWVINTVPGGVVPPPPPTPPTPPTPPPPAVGPTLSQLVNADDVFFSNLIQKNPRYASILRQVSRLLDQKVHPPLYGVKSFGTASFDLGTPRADIDWGRIVQVIQTMIHILGPEAVPVLDTWIERLNVPDWDKEALKALVQSLLTVR